MTHPTELANLILAFGLPGGFEWVVLVLLGLLIFGRRLPEVGRSIGRSIVEFKRGIKGIEDEIDEESSRPGDRDHAPRDQDRRREELPESRHDEQAAAPRSGSDAEPAGKVHQGSDRDL